MPETTAATPPPYDRDAIFRPNGPLDPRCVVEAVAAIKRATPIDPGESPDLVSRRMHCALRSLGALHARDEIELMLGVQALCAYHAACACWRLGMNLTLPHGDSTRHIVTAASASRAFDSMLRALERRQAKPLSVPPGRPEPSEWLVSDGTDEHLKQLWSTDTGDIIRPAPIAARRDPGRVTDDDVLDAFDEKDEEDLDLDAIEGILPGGGMIMPEEPTPQQTAYMELRLGAMYLREQEENRRNGIVAKTRFRPFRPGELIP